MPFGLGECPFAVNLGQDRSRLEVDENAIRDTTGTDVPVPLHGS